MTAIVAALCSTLWLVAMPPVAWAQRVVYSRHGLAPASSVVIDVPSGATIWASSDFSSRAVFTANGRWLVRDAVSDHGSRLSVVDLVTGVDLTLPMAFQPIVAHPRELAVYGLAAGAPARLDVGGLRVWPVCGTQSVVAVDLARNGDELFVLCGGTTLVVADSATGTLIRTVALGGAGNALALVVGPTGGDVTIARSDVLERLDAASGAVLATRSLAAGIAAMAGRDRFLAWTCALTPTPVTRVCHLRVLDSGSLADEVDLGFPGPVQAASAAADGSEVYVTGDNFRGSHESRRIAVPSGAVLNLVVAPLVTDVTLGVASRPLPPASLAANVAGSSVALTWNLPLHSPAATGYRLAIGSRTGDTDLGSVRLGPGETFIAAGVPSGRYFVRLHGVNHTGEGPASAELVVDVP